MRKRISDLPLGVLVSLTLGSAYILLSIVIILAVNHHMRQQALLEAESKAAILLERNLATHTYFTHKLKPGLFELTEPIRTEEYFDPTWMSSTYAVREIDRYFRELSELRYYYKECAIDARSPENEADAYERAFLERLNTDPTLTVDSQIRTIDGEPVLAVLRRGETMETSCLRCHGGAEEAPRGLLEVYGSERSFHRQVGETVSAISIRIPLAAAFSAANDFSLRLSTILLVGLLCLFVVQLALTRRLIFKPINALRDKAQQISTRPQHLGEQIPLPYSRELRDLGHAFNAMSRALRQSTDDLENQIAARTGQLMEANAALEHDIRERRRIEQQLQQERDLLRTFMDNMPDFMYFKDRESRFVQVNKAFARLVGVDSPEEVIGKTDFDYQPLEHAREAYADERRIMETGEALIGRVEKIEHPAGEVRWRRATKVPIKDEKGRITGLVGISTDITDWKRAEIALRESEQRFRTFFAAVPDYVYITDLEGNILDANPAMQGLTGLSQEQMRGHRAQMLFSSENVAHMSQALVTAGQGVQVRALETRGTTASGEIRHFETHLVPLREGETVARILSVTRDVTERVRAVEALRASQERYALATVAGRVGVWDWDLRTNEVFVDPVLKAMLGYEDHEISNHLDDWSRCIHPDDVAKVEAAAEAHLSGLKSEYEVVHRMVHRNGDIFWFSARGSALRDEEGKPYRLVGTDTDITELRRLEQQFLHAQRMDTVARLAGGIAHEFNNMLTNVIGYADFAREALPTGDPVREDIERVIASSNRLVDLTRRLLAFAQRQVLQPRLLNLNDLIREANPILSHLIGADIETEIHLDPDLGSIKADPGQIEQVLINLVVNAHDAMPEGGTLTITTSNVALQEADVRERPEMLPGNYVMLAISDTGVGMTAEVREHLFEPFFTTKEVGRGTGLGLAAAYGIIKQHDGDIWVHSEPGSGTRFEIYLPQVK